MEGEGHSATRWTKGRVDSSPRKDGSTPLLPLPPPSVPESHPLSQTEILFCFVNQSLLNATPGARLVGT